MNQEELFEILRAQEKVVPDEHDGCYEMVRTCVEAFAASGKDTFTIADLDMLYFMTIGDWVDSMEEKKSRIAACSIAEESKEHLLSVFERISQDTEAGKYENRESGKRSYGLFGKGFGAKHLKDVYKNLTDETSTKFIKLCIQISKTDALEACFAVAEAVSESAIPGMQAGNISQMLHCLKPSFFPVLNGFGREIYLSLGTELSSAKEAKNYIKNCRKIRDFFTLKNISISNYREVDLLYPYIDKGENEPSDAMNVDISKMTEEEIIEDFRKWYVDVKGGSPQSVAQSIGCLRNAVGVKYQVKPFLPDYDSAFLCIDVGTIRSARDSALKSQVNKEVRNMISAALGRYNDYLVYKMGNDTGTAPIAPIGEDEVEIAGKRNGLNIILCGPPGTGKTYSTVRAAYQICNGGVLDFDDSDFDYTSAKKWYDKELADEQDGHVAFTTFHQSYGYEEFIEGIRPVLLDDDDEESGDTLDIGYRIEAGIFKSFCERAVERRQDAGRDTSDEGKGNLENLIERFATHIQDMNDDGEEFPLVGKVTVIGINRYARDGRPRSFVLGGSNTSHTWISFNAVRRDYLGFLAEEIKTEDDVRGRNSNSRHGCARYLFSFYQRMKEFQESINYSFEESTDIQDVESEIVENAKPYVFIIDEINRGNISKIFGELITLIEPSKRAGQDDCQSVVLPYSKEPFSVPSNVYIIGTMNTADRSIALIDTALRRRFDFIEMMPKPELVEGKPEGIDLVRMLEAMNLRIEALYDREHTIGHTYLMDAETLDDLADAFKNKIIPLLQEYFFDDYQKIRLVLADNQTDDESKQFIVERPGYSGNLFGAGYTDDLPVRYVINEDKEDAFHNPEAYKKIYAGVSLSEDVIEPEDEAQE